MNYPQTTQRAPLAVVLTLILSFTACNVIIPGTPFLFLVRPGLGEYEARPTWAWDVRGPEIAQAFRYSIDSTTEWIVLADPAVRTFTPSVGLSPGSHVFRLQMQSVAGLWSETVSSGVTVESTIQAAPYEPNDPLFSADTDGSSIGQWALEMIRIPELWGAIAALDESGGYRDEIVVAVIDTGYTSHPDLVGNLLVNKGYDFVEETWTAADGDGADPDATDPGDDKSDGYGNSWHGTTVAGVIAAVSDNALGVAGIGTGRIRVLPLRALGRGGGYTYDISLAMKYAVGEAVVLKDGTSIQLEDPAKIINLSLGGYFYGDEFVEPILAPLAAQGIIMTAAAGNERLYGYTEVAYPASSPYTIAVGAVTYDKVVAYYSNPGAVDITAPGADGEGLGWDHWIVTPSPDPFAKQPLLASDYGYYGSVGTSIATPHVSGVLALLCSVDTSMDLEVALQVFAASSEDLGPPGADSDYGYGLIDSVAAFTAYTGADVVISTATPSPFRSAPAASLRPMGRTGTPPAGPAHEGTLILRFRSAADAAAAIAADLPGVRRIAPGTGSDRLVELESGFSYRVARDQLLLRPEVSEVFYNYRYAAM